MRPAVVEFLNDALGTRLFVWLVPNRGLVYVIMTTVLLIMFTRRATKVRLPTYHVVGAASWAMVGGLIGARALFLLLRIDDVIADPSLVAELKGGTISWGAYLGGGAGFWLYLQRHSQAAALYADTAASVLGLGPFIGRFACFLNGDDYGSLSDVAWGVSYPPASYPYVAQVAQGLLRGTESQSLPLHPVQLYLAANGLFLFLVFSWLWHRHGAWWRARRGALFLLFGAAYGVLRFGVEFFRGDRNRTFLGPFPDAQILALFTCLLFSGLLAVRLRRGPQKAALLRPLDPSPSV